MYFFFCFVNTNHTQANINKRTSGKERPPAIHRNSSTLSTHPESDMPSSITGYKLFSWSPNTSLLITPSRARIRLRFPRRVLISPLWANNLGNRIVHLYVYHSLNYLYIKDVFFTELWMVKIAWQIPNYAQKHIFCLKIKN